MSSSLRQPSAGTAPEPEPEPEPEEPEPGGTEEEPSRRWPGLVAAATVWIVLGAALALYWRPLLRIDRRTGLDAMNGLGLVSVLPPTALAGAALLAAAFAGGLALRAHRPVLLLAVLLSALVSLHAPAVLLETAPGPAAAWQHAGLVEYLGRTGTAAPGPDARPGWPGFHAAAALAARACGVTDLTVVLRWWPPAVQLLWLGAFALLLRAVRAGRRAKWCAAWFFVLGCWAGQDHFSPQSVAYPLYVLFVAVLLVWFRPVSRHHEGPGPIAGEADRAYAPRAERAALLALLVAVFAAAVVSHRLTPLVMLAVLFALVLVRRCALRGLPWLCAVLLTGWVWFAAQPYPPGGAWALLDALRAPSSSGGGDGLHRLVPYTRAALATAVTVLALGGWLRRHRAGYRDRALPVLLLVPLLGLLPLLPLFGPGPAAGVYDGDGAAPRVFLFALPGAAVLAALALFPRRSSDLRGRWGPLAALLAGPVLIGGFLVARWGDEPFERVRPGEIAAMRYIHEHGAPSARVLWLTDGTSGAGGTGPRPPWGAAPDVGRTVHVPVPAPRDPVLVGPVVRALTEAGPHSYLVVGRAQTTYLRMVAGRSASWPRKLLTTLHERPELRAVFSGPDAVVYEARHPAPRTAAAVPVPAPVAARTTRWTLIGLAAGGGAVLLLGARELARLLVPPRRRLRAMRLSLTLSVPLLVLYAGGLAERFLTRH